MGNPTNRASSPLLRASDGFLAQLDAQAAPVVEAVLREYERIQRRLLVTLEEYEMRIADLERTDARAYLAQRYAALAEQVADEMDRLGDILAGQVAQVGQDAVDTAIESAREMVLLQNNDAGIVGAFNRLDPLTVNQAIAFTQPGSPITNMLRGQYGRGWADVIAAEFINGVAQGKSPRAVIRTLRQTVTVAMPADLDRIIRTAQLWSYRSAQQATWKRSGFVDYWTWSSAKDSRTCGSCWALDGTKHPIDEVMNDHHRGRCAAIPHVGDTPDQNIPTGAQAFAALPRDEQTRIAEAGGWGPHLSAIRGGAMRFADMTGVHDDSIYGPMRVQRSLKAILGEDAQEFYR